VCLSLSIISALVKYPSVALMGLHTKGRRLALPENIWLGRKCLIVKNTLAYCGTEFIMTVKSFIVKGLML